MAALLLGALPLVIASIILPMRVQSTLTEVGHDHLIEVSRGLATQTENELERHLEAVRSLAQVEMLRNAIFRQNLRPLDGTDLAAVNRQVRRLLQGLAANQYQGMFLCGTDGFIFAGVLKDGDTARYAHLDIRDRLYLRQARETLQPVVSDPLTSKVDGVPIIVVAVPVLDAQGAFAGLVGLSIELDDLAAMISAPKLGRTGYPFAIDRHGVLVAHPDPAREFKLNLSHVPGTARLAERMMRGETGVESYVSSKGAVKLAAFSPVPIAGWSVAASIETKEFAAPADALRRIIFAMIGACVVIAAIVAVTLAMGLEELKRTLGVARESEQRFKLFASVANETIWDLDLATDALWWSEGLTAAFGYDRAEIEATRRALSDRVRADERDEFVAGLRECETAGRWVGEHHFRRRDGSEAYVLHRVVAVRDAAGRAVRLVGGMTDISRRRATEEKLAEQAALLDEARDGILVRDLDDVIHFWSRGAERLYGWSAAEAVGRRLGELLRADARAIAEAEARVRVTGEWSGHLRKTTKDGTLRLLDCRWTLLRDDRGRPKSILTIDTDITEREQMEAKFLRAQRLESIGTLAGGIAHDLNNLLAPIVMGVGMLKLSAQNADDAEVIRYIEQSAQRGTHLVKQVLSFARGIDGARVAVHAGYVVREVEDMLRCTLPKNIALRSSVPKDVWLIHADPTQLNQILLNLCVNARDAMPDGGELAIAVRNVRLDEHFARGNREVAPGAHVLIEVADTGTGMSPEVQEKIFEPFFTTKASGQGTGLGLSTVIGITRSHGGTITVSSEPGKGSVFKVYLPAMPEERGSASPAGPQFADAPVAGHGECILLVDDEATILSVTGRLLEQSGYRVLTAGDGAQALALYHQRRDEIAVVVTDMMMPAMDGAALIAALRQLDPHVAIVAASGVNDPNQTPGSSAGVRHFLCKPYPAAELLAAIADALSGRLAAPGVPAAR